MERLNIRIVLIQRANAEDNCKDKNIHNLFIILKFIIITFIYFAFTDSCIAGNKSPRSRLFSKPQPFQQKLSPAEQQYESYVKATVAANAKSPVEELLTSPPTAQPPPPPPPRKHSLVTSSLTSPVSPVPATVSAGCDNAVDNTDSSLSPDKAPPKTTTTTTISLVAVANNENAPSTTAAAADAQTLFNIRQQMALSLKRMKDLEEQVKAIPDLQV